MDIEKLADEFFEWDGPRTPVVSFVSAKLFARHVAELAAELALKEAARTAATLGVPGISNVDDDAVAEWLRKLTIQLTPPQEPTNG